MPSPGPKPAPKNIKRLRGNPGRRRLEAAGDAEFQAAIPDPPEGLRGGALEIYNHHCRVLAAARVLTEGDRDLIARLAWTTHEINQQVREMEVEPRLYKSKRGAPVPNPRLRVIRDLIAQERGLMAEAGLSPTARNRLKTVQAAQGGPVTKEQALALKLWGDKAVILPDEK